MATHIEKLRHTASHILAMAMLRLYPETKMGIAVATEGGFFHDFELSKQLEKEDLVAITEEMQQIVREKQLIQALTLPREIAVNTLLQRGQIYKAELLQDIDDTEIHFYKIGTEFIDLCRHPHVHNTQELRAFQLTAISGAYWKGDENRPQLQRISGIAFRSQDDMQAFMEREALLADLDYRYIGEKLDYFRFVDDQIYYTQFGQSVLSELNELFQKLSAQSEFAPIGLPFTSNNLNKELEELYSIKNRSYRELPIRWSAMGRTNKEKSIRQKTVIGTTQAALMTTATSQNFDVEIREQLNVLISFVRELKIDPIVKILTPDADNDFVKTISAFLATKGINHTQVINTKNDKVTAIATCLDEFEREWQIFDLSIYHPSNNLYASREGEITPAVTIIGTLCIELFLAFLLENSMGELPFWLSPKQCVIVPISEKYQFYAEKVRDGFLQLGVTTEIDSRAEKMESRIRDAEMKKIPLIVIVGDKEEHSGTVSVRTRGGSEVGLMDLNEISSLLSRVS